MNTINAQSRKGEKGFTLVELAIVMIIIGLLTGGVLKGQELINNAQITSTVSSMKGYDAAISTFRDSFNALPGDIANAVTRLPNCAATNICGASDAAANKGNGQIGTLPGGAHTVETDNASAWAHMAAADLIAGVDPTALVAAPNQPVAPGVALPLVNLGQSNLKIGFADGTTALQAIAAAAPANTGLRGHYMLIDLSNNAASSTATVTLTPIQAQRVDNKLDDGRPNTGSVLAMTGPATSLCAQNGTPTALYNTQIRTLACGLYIRVQN